MGETGSATDQYHWGSVDRYSGWLLTLSGLGLLCGVVLMAVDNSTGPDGQSDLGIFGTFGMLLCLAVYVFLVAINWPGFIRAIAAHRWLRHDGDVRAVWISVLLYVFVVPYVLMFYPLYGLFQYARGYLRQRQRYPLEHQRRVAELEAELGIDPKVEGTCPNCGKPLQVGAEFCSFCGVRVKPVVRLCPRCGAVSLPDAEWCARCGAPLGQASSSA